MNHINQEPLDFAAALSLMRKCRNELAECRLQLDALRKVNAALSASSSQMLEAIALLRELNDALVIQGWLQPRVDAVLDRHEQHEPTELECLSTSTNCRRRNTKAVNCCALYEHYAKTSLQREKT